MFIYLSNIFIPDAFESTHGRENGPGLCCRSILYFDFAWWADVEMGGSTKRQIPSRMRVTDSPYFICALALDQVIDFRRVLLASQLLRYLQVGFYTTTYPSNVLTWFGLDLRTLHGFLAQGRVKHFHESYETHCDESSVCGFERWWKHPRKCVDTLQILIIRYARFVDSAEFWYVLMIFDDMAAKFWTIWPEHPRSAAASCKQIRIANFEFKGGNKAYYLSIPQSNVEPPFRGQGPPAPIRVAIECFNVSEPNVPATSATSATSATGGYGGKG